MEEQKDLTPEEIQERKEKLLSYYQEQVKFLTVQLEYETLVTDIEEQRAKRVQIQAAIAGYFAPEPEEEEEETPLPRTLKKSK
jgi:hypothetical protein